MPSQPFPVQGSPEMTLLTAAWGRKRKKEEGSRKRRKTRKGGEGERGGGGRGGGERGGGERGGGGERSCSTICRL